MWKWENEKWEDKLENEKISKWENKEMIKLKIKKMRIENEKHEELRYWEN